MWCKTKCDPIQSQPNATSEYCLVTIYIFTRMYLPIFINYHIMYRETE